LVIKLTAAELEHCREVVCGPGVSGASKEASVRLDHAAPSGGWIHRTVLAAFQKMFSAGERIQIEPLAETSGEMPTAMVQGWRVSLIPAVWHQDWLLVPWNILAAQYEMDRLSHFWLLAAVGWMAETNRPSVWRLTGTVDFKGFACLHRMMPDLVNTKVMYQGHVLPETEGDCVPNDCFAIHQAKLYGDWHAFRERLNGVPFATKEIYAETYREIKERLQFNRVCETFEHVIYSPELNPSERDEAKSQCRHSFLQYYMN